MASGPEPLRLALRAALDEKGLSVRKFALLCHEARPSQSRDSWKRAINKALAVEPKEPYNPSPETAELWASLLGKPPGFFVRQPTRETVREERDRLRLEVERLRRALEEQGGATSEGGRA